MASPNGSRFNGQQNGTVNPYDMVLPSHTWLYRDVMLYIVARKG